MEKWDGLLCSKIQQKLETMKSKSCHYNCEWDGGTQYHVKAASREEYVVDLKERTCSCRKWDLCRIPCAHAVYAICNAMPNGGSEVNLNFGLMNVLGLRPLSRCGNAGHNSRSWRGQGCQPKGKETDLASGQEKYYRQGAQEGSSMVTTHGFSTAASLMRKTGGQGTIGCN
ncbi:hypothetical protein RJ639_027431 [Escallonia herrerae]|uniref:SWIM-type domain-containing protein n=1 Tax=Escallonia herrerae TaxID=1293975 RepID=A0AA88X309_9ASTE|nr:hypothetical protein RJ639_027431 [Escallonia herrerae]